MPTIARRRIQQPRKRIGEREGSLPLRGFIGQELKLISGKNSCKIISERFGLRSGRERDRGTRAAGGKCIERSLRRQTAASASASTSASTNSESPATYPRVVSAEKSFQSRRSYIVVPSFVFIHFCFTSQPRASTIARRGEPGTGIGMLGTRAGLRRTSIDHVNNAQFITHCTIASQKSIRHLRFRQRLQQIKYRFYLFSLLPMRLHGQCAASSSPIIVFRRFRCLARAAADTNIFIHAEM